MPSTAPFVPETPPREEAAPSQTKRPIRWMHWLAGIVLLAVVAGLVVFAVGNDGSESVTQPTPRSAVNGEVWATQPLLITTPRSALNGEVWADPTAAHHHPAERPERRSVGQPNRCSSPPRAAP